MPYKDPERNRAFMRGHMAARRQEIRDFLHDAKSVPCTDCGDPHPYYVMHFHHCRGTKAFNLSRASSSPTLYTRAKIEAEIAKCDVVCANCHAYRHGPDVSQVT